LGGAALVEEEDITVVEASDAPDKCLGTSACLMAANGDRHVAARLSGVVDGSTIVTKVWPKEEEGMNNGG